MGVHGATSRWRPVDVVGPVAVFAAFIGLWYLVREVLMSPSRRFLVPPPHRVVNESFLTWSHLRPMLDGLWATTRVALTGLAIAIVLGVGLAVLMSQARWLERALLPYVVALQAVPVLAFVPLIGALFDFDGRARVVVVVMVALFPVVSTTLHGLLSVDPAHHDLFTLQGASRWTRLRKLMLPAALPSMFTGFRIAAALAVVGAVVGDLFFRQGEPGIGRLIDVYRSRLFMERMYGAVVLAALLGIVVFALFGALAQRAVGHWHGTPR